MINIPIILKGQSYTKYTDYSQFETDLDNLPTSIEKHEIGTSSDGRTIYGLSIGDYTNKPVIFVTGTVHGQHEWDGAHYTQQFMSLLANPPSNLKRTVTKLKNKFAFYTIPMVNTYGYFNYDYKNANGVNLNRNFEKNWDIFEGEIGTEQYKGTEPFSEPESKILKVLLETLKPTMYIDCHTHGTRETGLTTGGNKAHEYLIRDLTYSVDAKLNKGVILQPFTALIWSAVSTWATTLKAKTGGNCIGYFFEVEWLITEEEKATEALNFLLTASIYAYMYAFDKKQRYFDIDLPS